MTVIEIVLALSMFFGGAVGSIGIWLLRDIRDTLTQQARWVRDIDIRVVRLESVK